MGYRDIFGDFFFLFFGNISFQLSLSFSSFSFLCPPYETPRNACQAQLDRRLQWRVLKCQCHRSNTALKEIEKEKKTLKRDAKSQPLAILCWLFVMSLFGHGTRQAGFAKPDSVVITSGLFLGVFCRRGKVKVGQK